MDEIHIDFQWQRDEFMRVSRKGPIGRAGKRFVIEAVVMIVAGITLITNWSSGFGWFIIGLGLFYSFFGFWLLVGGPKKSWKSGVDIQDPISYLIDDNGVTTKGSSSETRLSWKFFRYSREWSDYYVLLQGRRGVPKVIPKRGLKSEKDEARLRALLESRTKAQLIPNGRLDAIW
jgi:hypothetical protein